MSDIPIRWERINQDLDHRRPTMREGATMIQYKNKLFLYGGVGQALFNTMNVYDTRTNQWNQIKMKGDSPPIHGRFGHSVAIYKNQMILYGGQGEYNFRIKQKECKNDMYSFDMDKYEWQMLKVKNVLMENRRNHMSTCIERFLFIFGGIDSSEKYLADMIVINLENMRAKEYPFYDQLGLAYTEAVPIVKKYISKFYQVQQTSNKIKIPKLEDEGVYVFGGKNGKGRPTNKLLIFKVDQRDTPVDWVKPTTKGIPPPPRFQHSTIYYPPLNSLLIYGGINDKTSEIFDDFWIFSMVNSQYYKVDIQNTLNRERYGHAAAISETRMFIFGGLHAEKYADWDIYYFELDPKHQLRQKNIVIDRMSMN